MLGWGDQPVPFKWLEIGERGVIGGGIEEMGELGRLGRGQVGYLPTRLTALVQGPTPRQQMVWTNSKGPVLTWIRWVAKVRRY